MCLLCVLCVFVVCVCLLCVCVVFVCVIHLVQTFACWSQGAYTQREGEEYALKIQMCHFLLVISILECLVCGVKLFLQQKIPRQL